jgi:hypothetical protein
MTPYVPLDQMNEFKCDVCHVVFRCAYPIHSLSCLCNRVLIDNRYPNGARLHITVNNT